MKIIELSLKLFHAVLKGEAEKPQFKKTLKYGVVVAENAAYAIDEIIMYLKRNKLSGEQLNSTFHKSWKVIKESSREELLIHQILHYFTTYGTNFTFDFIYIPAEKLKVPKVKDLPLKVIHGLEKNELIGKALAMLESGIALEERTIDEILELLSLLNYKFKSVDTIRNKEALTKIIAKTGVYPSNPIEFLRYLVYLSTESTLLIKNAKTIEMIKAKRLNVVMCLNGFGLEKCATIFNRFKPLWLAFKSNKDNIQAINKIGKLSKTFHKPMPVDVLNTATSIKYKKKEVKKALESANSFRKIRLLNALNTRINKADAFLYRVRNGKSFSKEKGTNLKIKYYKKMFDLVYADLVESMDVKGKKIKYPENIDYALPSSEKMFLSNIPIGTRISDEKLVSGVYWENEWGARDLDLSALSLEGKIGWNTVYKGQGLMYSGDVTSAPYGATELLYSTGKIPSPALSKLNIYSGEVGCKFKIIIGNASKVSKNYMFNPNELVLEVETETKSRQQIVGITIPTDKGLDFILINTGFGNISVSGNSSHSENARNALYYQFSKPVSFRRLLIDAGAEIVADSEFDIDLMPQNLQKDSLINLFN